MFGWGESHDSYQQMYQDDNSGQFTDNQASLSHEVVSGGAAFAAMKIYEDRQRKEGKSIALTITYNRIRHPNIIIGKPVSHQFAKEALAGIAAAEVDRLAETKGEDFFDRERAKRDAAKGAQNMYDEHYGGSDQYDPNQQGPHDRLQQQFGDNQWGGNNY